MNWCDFMILWFQSKLQEWEELVRSDDKVSAVEARLQKDIRNLKREKEVLTEDVEVRGLMNEEIRSSLKM